jgi:elongation factor Tu
MAIEGTYHIAGRGCVVTGTIDTGAVKIGDEIDIVGYVPKAVKTSVVGIETFRK